MELKNYFPIWNQLTETQQKMLSDAAVSRTVKKGTVIHNGSEDCVGLLLIKSGQLRAFIRSEEGREITIYRLFDLDICLFSASCMLSSIQFDVSIEAEKDTDLWVIPSEVYKQLTAQSAPLSNYTNEIMASRFSEVMWLIDQILWKRFDQRLAAFLLEEAELEGTDCLKITQEAIGNHLGTAREVVTRMLSHFQSEGLVKLSRGVVQITDSQKLQKLYPYHRD